ncbi:acetyl-coenzyme A synthetase N-terminal domain-containing protein [Arthrobacter alpinus]|nr:acetyl-coenzyme A synthetase N-terminal domain-containing protein [Arthrobacter alpinus]
MSTTSIAPTARTVRSEEDAARVNFWAEQAQRLDWAQPWHTDHSFEPAMNPVTGDLQVPHIEWFAGGKLNAAVNCVDRHVDAGNGNKVALFCEGEPGIGVPLPTRNSKIRCARPLTR